MNCYILSILGIVLAGVIIEVIIPSGNINKYIKGVYSIFVVAVLISPVITFVSKAQDITVNYTDYEIDSELIEYILTKRVENIENEMEIHLQQEGFSGIDIKLDYSLNNNEICYNSCTVNLENLAISADKQHINKYEFINEVVVGFTNLTYEEIKIYE